MLAKGAASRALSPQFPAEWFHGAHAGHTYCRLRAEICLQAELSH
jgi:hypothetical protein